MLPTFNFKTERAVRFFYVRDWNPIIFYCFYSEMGRKMANFVIKNATFGGSVKRGFTLPAYPGNENWGEKARAFWRAIHRKITPEILTVLFRLIILVDQLEKHPSTRLREEVRLLARELDLLDELEGIFYGTAK